VDESSISQLRILYRDLISKFLFFDLSTADEIKKEVENLFVETWDCIPSTDRNQIQANLEFIVCKDVVDGINQTPGIAQPLKNGYCFIVFNPFFRELRWETRIHILAHELSHIYYKHPVKGEKMCVSQEKVFIETIAEPEAYKLTEKWGIKPHPDDVQRLRGYKKYVLHSGE
jgi:hypothetical protein